MVIGVIVLGLATLGILMVLEIPFAPWIRSFGLWPTLTGEWLGTLERPDGRLSFVYFDIRGSLNRYNPDIYGKAKWCDDNGRIWSYEIWGDTDNWRGTRFHLSTRNAIARESGESPAELRGVWNDDVIRATGVLVTHSRTATAEATRTSRSPGPPQVSYTLRRGNEKRFLAACR